MVDTIGAVVRGRRAKRSSFVVVAHIAGATITAALVGISLGGLGRLLGAPWGTVGVTAIATVGLLYLVRETTGARIPLPERKAQVPSWWREFYSPGTAAFLFGAGLGVGFLTFLTFGTYAVVATAAFVSGDPIIGAILCAPFGIARAIGASAAGAAGRSFEASQHRVEGIGEGRTPMVANAIVLAAIPAIALAGILL